MFNSLQLGRRIYIYTQTDRCQGRFNRLYDHPVACEITRNEYRSVSRHAHSLSPLRISHGFFVFLSSFITLMNTNWSLNKIKENKQKKTQQQMFQDGGKSLDNSLDDLVGMFSKTTSNCKFYNRYTRSTSLHNLSH